MGTKPMDLEAEVREIKRDAFLDYLLKTDMSPDKHIPCYGKVLSVDIDDTVPRVMRRLSSEGFSSAPVLEGGTFVGFVDMLDLTKFVTNMFFGTTSALWVDFWEKESKFQVATVGDVMENRRAVRVRAKRRPLTPEPVFKDNSLMHALEIMVKSEVHRLAILDDRWNRKLVGIFTQSMLISEITQRLYMLGELRYKVVDTMTGFFRDAKSISIDAKAINAFNVMSQEDITGLAVVDNEGTLVDALSVSDLKCVGVNGENFSWLFKTVKEFKQFSREAIPLAAPRSHYSKKPVPRTALFVSEKNTFEDVIRKMDDGNIHRVFVCSQVSINRGQPEPLHVITQTDVFKHIFNHYTWAFL